MLLPMFDPTLEPPEEPSAETERLVPLYKQAKIRGPNALMYLWVLKVGSRQIEHEFLKVTVPGELSQWLDEVVKITGFLWIIFVG